MPTDSIMHGNQGTTMPSSDRDEEVEELRRRVAYLEGILASTGMKPEDFADGGEEKKQEDTGDCLTRDNAAKGATDTTPSADGANGDELPDDKNQSSLTINTNSEAETPDAGNENTKSEPFHPPGIEPGGSWYKQTYKGSRTQSASNVVCCLLGCTESYLVSQIALDERFVYFDQKGTQRYYDAFGQPVVGVTARGSTLSAIPPETVKGAIERGQVPPPLAKPDPVAKKNTVPPGLPEGGLFYKQYIRNGRTRLIYRPDPMGMDFYDQSGRKVNLFEGPVVPPVTMMSLL